MKPVTLKYLLNYKIDCILSFKEHVYQTISKACKISNIILIKC